MCTCSEATLAIGACSDQNPSSATMDAISDAALHTLCAGSAMTSRPVFSTDVRMLALSSGTSVRGSITSTDIPSASSSCAAAIACGTEPAIATTVPSVPSRSVFATPNGMSSSPLGRSSLAGTSPRLPNSVPSSNMITTSLSRIAVFMRPFMSAGFDGATILSPGMFINIGYERSEWWAAEPPP